MLTESHGPLSLHQLAGKEGPDLIAHATAVEGTRTVILPTRPHPYPATRNEPSPVRILAIALAAPRGETRESPLTAHTAKTAIDFFSAIE